MIWSQLDDACGLSSYQQVVRQVRHARCLGMLREKDRLPAVKELAARLQVNQNTVLKAYRELEHAGIVAAQPGVGTFVAAASADTSAHGPLRADLARWVAAARHAGLDDETVEALFADVLGTAAVQLRSSVTREPFQRG